MNPADTAGSHAEPDRLIRSLYTGQLAWSARERAYDLKLGAAFATVRRHPEQTAALHRLIYGLPPQARLRTIEPIAPTIGPQAGNTGLDALLHFAIHQQDWLQDPETWRPETDDPLAQAGSLARHLYGIYPLPAFLDTVWLLGFSDEGEAYRRWFVHLGRGEKLEAIRFPMPMTHRAAHFFLQAPDEFTLPSAMRYGQIRALGGSPSMARIVSETFLSELQADETFWYSVIHFLINHPQIPLSQIGPLLDFIRHRRFDSHGGPGPEPNFSMKGRTVDALQKRMAEWHETLARLGKKARQSWVPSGIAPLDLVERDKLSPAMCHWRIIELTDTITLAEEGREMRHCVRTYADACFNGKTSIWSLRLTLSDNPAQRRLVTIEVNNHRRAIVQVRAKCNQTLTALRSNHRMMLAKTVLKGWAYANHLGVACSL